MFCSRTKHFYLLVLSCSGVWFLYTHNFHSHKRPDPPNVRDQLWNTGNSSVISGGTSGISLAKQAIVRVENAKAFVISAYFDDRFSPGMVRIIGIVYRAGYPNFYCHFSDTKQILTIKAKVLVHNEHFNFPYGTADFLCKTPAGAGDFPFVHVGVSPQMDPPGSFLKIRNTVKNISADFPSKFSVCISTMFGNYSNVLQVVQAVEMYRILGAHRVIFYKSSCSALMQSVLDYYTTLGVVEVIPWNIHLHLKASAGWQPHVHPGDLHYYGQVTALNDCIYYNMYSSHYVVLNDIDEVIVPNLHQDWGEMMRFLSRRHLGVNAFLFENAVFPYSVFGDNGTFDLERWASIPGVNILRHVHREPERFLTFNPRKLIVNPRAMIWTSVHNVPWLSGDWLKVSGTVARLHHYRTPEQPHLRKEDLIRDTTLWRYKASLTRNVDHVLQEVLGKK
nr:PREDICTED: uncharacterized protein LOC107079820 [Lepisosteus oculatus]